MAAACLQYIIDIGFEHICFRSVDGLDAAVLFNQAHGALCLPLGQSGNLIHVLYRDAQTGHAGVHQDNVIPAAQKGDDASGLAVTG